MYKVISLACITSILISCTPTHKEKVKKEVETLPYKLVRTYAHDTLSYTQGLEYKGDVIIESSGRTGKSFVAEVDIEKGTFQRKYDFDSTEFGEGLTILGNKIYVLTLQSNLIYIFDKTSYQLLNKISLSYRGWGLCNDGKNLIYTNGSNRLFYLDTSTFSITREVPVYEENMPLNAINEMEYVNGHIFANIYMTNLIYVINAETGEALYKIDLKDLAADARHSKPNIDVLNGIAFKRDTRELLVTGKYWPKYYLISTQDPISKRARTQSSFFLGN